MTSGSSRVLSWLIYPTVMTLAFALFALLQSSGVSRSSSAPMFPCSRRRRW